MQNNIACCKENLNKCLIKSKILLVNLRTSWKIDCQNHLREHQTSFNFHVFLFLLLQPTLFSPRFSPACSLFFMFFVGIIFKLVGQAKKCKLKEVLSARVPSMHIFPYLRDGFQEEVEATASDTFDLLRQHCF